MRFINRSGYDTGDLKAFVEKALRVYGISGRDRLEVIAVAAPQRSRGCAEVGTIYCSRHYCTRKPGKRMVLAIAPPSYYGTYEAFARRLQHLIRHEGAHINGMEHQDMDHHLLYSLGPVSRWALWPRIHYRGRAPNQIHRLG